MKRDDLRATAAQCRHYAMCKIDYLGTGLCPSGSRRHYVAYFPQGRMDLYNALAREALPVTEGLLDIADSCNLCGVCDPQCHFVTGLRPLAVMKDLKARLDEHRKKGGEILRPPQDQLLGRIRKIVGREWASNDPAILLTYADDPFPLSGPKTPRYVVLPGTTEEVSAVVRLANRNKIPIAVRGNGASVFGAVFSEGLVLDMNRMREISIDAENWSAEVGAGVTSFDLQREAARRGLRANAAEPAATVCGNIICTGTFSTWSNAYGLAADNILDMEFVDRKGRVIRLAEKRAPNILAYEHAVRPFPGICTRAMVRLYPVSDDEEGLLVPFADFQAALGFVRELGARRIGLAVAVLGRHYLATFLSPTRELADRLKEVFPDILGLQYGVVVIADHFGREAVRKMAGSVIDAGLVRTLMLGLPNMASGEWLDILRGAEGSRPLYDLLCRPETRPLLEAVLDPSAETLASAVDLDLKEFYTCLYRRPEYTNMVWLNTFRVVSARMGRHKHIIAFIVFVPLDKPEIIEDICLEFARIGRAVGIDHDYGFLTPLDFGKRAVLEYDFYIDHTDPEEKDKAGRAMALVEPWLDELAAEDKGIIWLKTLFGQGCARKESFLFRGLAGRKKA